LPEKKEDDQFHLTTLADFKQTIAQQHFLNCFLDKQIG